MASFVSQHQATGYDTVKPYEPDFSWMSGVLSTKETQYEKGLSEIASGYSAIINAPVTSFENIEKRKEYISAAQEGLKKITTQDLSKDKNVRQAEALYAPFWEDEDLLYDIGYTKYENNELSRLSSWEMNTDKSIRSQYHPDAKLWIQQGLEDLQNTKRGQIKNFKKRAAVPFYDIDAEINAAYKAQENKGVDSVDIYGNRIVTNHNGIKSKDNFRTWYLQQVGNRYDNQLYVAESVKIHRAKQEILQNNPGMDPVEVNKEFAQQQMNALNRGYSGNIAAYDKMVGEWTQKYTDLYTQVQAPGSKASPSDIANLQMYKDYIKQYHEQAEMYRQEYEKYGSGDVYTENYNRTLKDITEHPEDYLAGIQKSIMADNWATAMSKMNTGTKVELDPGWDAYMKYAGEAANRTLRQREIDATRRGQDYELYEKTGKKYPGGPQDADFNAPGNQGWIQQVNSTGGNGVSGKPNPQSGSFIGPQTIDPAKLELTVDKVQDIQDGEVNKITNSIYDPDRGLSAALKVSGLDETTIIDFTQAAKQGLSTGTMTNSGRAAWGKVINVLNDAGINTENIKGPKGMESAIIEYTAIAAQKLFDTKNTKKIAQGRALINAYMNVKGQRDKVLANKMEYEQAIITEFNDHPEKYNKISVIENGNRRMVNHTDIARDLRTVGLDNVTAKGQDGKEITLTTEEVADMYMRGDIDEHTGTINIKGTNYDIIKTNGAPNVELYTNPRTDYYNKTNRFNDLFIGAMKRKYGAPSEITATKRKMSEAVIPKLKYYDNGLIVQSQQFDPNIPGQYNMAVGASKEAVNPAVTVISKSYIEGGVPDKDQLPVMTAVRNLIGDEEGLKKYTNGYHMTITPDGTPALAYTFKNTPVQDDAKIEGIPVSKLQGKTFVFPLNPNVKTDYISSLPWNDGNYINKELLYTDQAISSDPVVQASGWRSTIKPYDKVNGKNTRCAIVIEKSIPDVLNPGKTKWVKDASKTYNLLQGDDAKTPDEIVYMTNALLSSHLNNIVQQAEIKEQSIRAGTPIR